MHVNIHTSTIDGASVSISDSAAKAVRMSFNPSARPEVDLLKALAAAFISQCDAVVAAYPDAEREAAVAKTNMQTASMWGVFAATTGL